MPDTPATTPLPLDADAAALLDDFDAGHPALTPAQLRALPELGGRADPSTVFRWFKNGRLGRDGQRHRLPSLKVGGATVTSRPALRRRAASLTATGPTPAPLPRTPHARERAIARAEAAKDVGPIFAASADLAAVSPPELSTVRAERSAWKKSGGVAFNLNDLTRAVGEARERAKREQRRERRREHGGGRPDICTTGRQLRDVVDDALRAWSAANARAIAGAGELPPTFFRGDLASPYAGASTHLE